MVLLQNSISQRQGISDDKEIARGKKRCDAAMGKCREHGTQISPLYLNPRKRSQFSLGFIRWLRYHLTSYSLFCNAIGSSRFMPYFEAAKMNTIRKMIKRFFFLAILMS
jgi:hypothetical protein